MTRSTNMEHVEVLERLRDRWVMPGERPALDAAIAALSAQRPPAEAQAQGGGELWHMVAKLAAHVRPTCGELWAEAERLLNRTTSPSAPVGVEGLPEKWRRGAPRARVDVGEDASLAWREAVYWCAFQLEAALAQQPAACAHSWNDYGTVNRAWCSRCNAVAVTGHEDRPYGVLSVTDDGEYRTNPIQQPATVDGAICSLPALWRQREDNGEERTEFDKGYEQASDECAEALERALAQQPAAVNEAAVKWAVERWHDEVANRPLVNVHRPALDGTWRQVIRHFGGDDVALCGPDHYALAAQQGGSDNDR